MFLIWIDCFLPLKPLCSSNSKKPNYFYLRTAELSHVHVKQDFLVRREENKGVTIDKEADIFTVVIFCKNLIAKLDFFEKLVQITKSIKKLLALQDCHMSLRLQLEGECATGSMICTLL